MTIGILLLLTISSERSPLFFSPTGSKKTIKSSKIRYDLFTSKLNQPCGSFSLGDNFVVPILSQSKNEMAIRSSNHKRRETNGLLSRWFLVFVSSLFPVFFTFTLCTVCSRPEKEAKGAVLHGTSAAGRLRHVKSCSANLPKLDDSHRLKHMERFVFAPAVRGRGKNPLTSHVERFCGRCLGLPAAPSGPRPVYSGSGFELSSSVQWNISLKSLKHSGQIQ